MDEEIYSYDAEQFKLVEVKDAGGVLKVVQGGKEIGRIVHTDDGRRAGWFFKGDPTDTVWGDREAAAQALLMVHHLSEVLRYHVTEEAVFENAIRTAVNVRKSYAVRGRFGADIKIFTR